ncbi:phospho-N-acetylmuramoyl-pentapeptide-transferase [Enterobacteriaceae endosymbiont of Macroplea appendiculata]|uniref:phospho-N-acetylmuramoyl-pentapeptide- transferase n=1 Tax=Enterobacteriaceae endosymbiont of Macroplea appendiculata TaxID=2675790 RepID=UPI00145770EA|nr:phospho-N-acetylmuramoyl-pentapeptide-transferase [Enterobacteriaceae endosymbiont of Macroplea appendiculata]
MSFITSLSIVLFFLPIFIKYTNSKKIFQVIRLDGPDTHLKKHCVPTMGGIIIVLSIFLTIILWANLYNLYIWYVLFILVSYAFIGLIDDYYKFILQNSTGLSIKKKFFSQSFIAIILSFFICKYDQTPLVLQILIPFYKNILYPINNITYIIIIYLIIVGLSNAINLTDGLDGLAITPTIFISLGLTILCYIVGNLNFAQNFHLIYIQHVPEISIVCFTIIGSGLGFLWFNAYPAIIFMGDIGSLTIGSLVGLIIVLVKQEYLSLIMCSVFIIEALSVIIQVLIFKLKKKRCFLMAPIHHHFELKGYHESHIVIRFWILTIILIINVFLILQINQQ